MRIGPRIHCKIENSWVYSDKAAVYTLNNHQQKIPKLQVGVEFIQWNLGDKQQSILASQSQTTHHNSFTHSIIYFQAIQNCL
jgi:hypothetical protein